MEAFDKISLQKAHTKRYKLLHSSIILTFLNQRYKFETKRKSLNLSKAMKCE